MTYSYSTLLFSLPGIFIIINAIFGIVRKDLTTHGRGGKRKNYKGSEAVKEGCFQILFGMTFVAFSIFMFMNSAK